MKAGEMFAKPGNGQNEFETTSQHRGATKQSRQDG